jgi:hypothetical protein
VTTSAMQGLEYNQPTEISTTFAASVTVSTWRVNDYGLVADVPAGDGVDRYFVPWSQLKYAKQHVVTPAP